MFGFNKNRQVSYVDLHNRAVIRYRRACKAFIWAGVVNFLGLIIGIIQYYVQKSTASVPFYLCFGTCDFVFSLLAVANMNAAIYWILVFVINIALTAGAVLLGLYSSFGKKPFLFSMIGSYFLDWILCFLAYFLVHQELIALMIDAGIHVVVSFFLILAVYQYYNVFNIEKRFKDIPTVAETKAKEKMESEENSDEHQS